MRVPMTDEWGRGERRVRETKPLVTSPRRNRFPRLTRDSIRSTSDTDLKRRKSDDLIFVLSVYSTETVENFR